MKRKLSIALVLAALLALGLAACGRGDDETGTSSTSASSGGSGSTTDEGSTTQEPQESPQPQNQPGGDGSADGSNPDGNAEPQGSPEAEGNPEANGSPGSKQGGQAESGGKPEPAPPPGPKGVREFGETADTSEREAASAVLETYLRARAEEDWETMCGVLTREVVGSLEELASNNPEFKGKNCVELFTAVAKQAPPESVEELAGPIDSLRIEGDRGYAIYAGAGGKEFSIQMLREGGDWKVNSFEAVPLS